MKTLNVTFTDKEFNELGRIKKKSGSNISWHFLILRGIRKFKRTERRKRNE